MKRLMIIVLIVFSLIVAGCAGTTFGKSDEQLMGDLEDFSDEELEAIAVEDTSNDALAGNAFKYYRSNSRSYRYAASILLINRQKSVRGECAMGSVGTKCTNSFRTVVCSNKGNVNCPSGKSCVVQDRVPGRSAGGARCQ